MATAAGAQRPRGASAPGADGGGSAEGGGAAAAAASGGGSPRARARGGRADDRERRGGAPGDEAVLGRFVATKHSWKGRYKRVLVVTDRRLYTLDPNDCGPGATPTNSYVYDGSGGLVSAAPTGGAVAVGATRMALDVTLGVRADGASSKLKEIRWSCVERAALLTELQRALADAAARAQRNGATPPTAVAWAPRRFAAARLRRGSGEWLECVLEVGASGVRELHERPASGELDSHHECTWQLDYRDMAAPGAALLADADAFVLRGGRGFTPRCFSARGGGGARPVLDAICSASAAAVGVTVSVAAAGGAIAGGAGAQRQQPLGVEQFRAQQAERRRRLDVTQEAPRASFRVTRLKGPGAALAGLADDREVTSNGDATGSERSNGFDGGGGASPRTITLLTRRVERTLQVYSKCLLDRRDDFAPTANRPLAALASVVRHEAAALRLTLHWSDGAPPSEYECSRRDEFLAALLDAAYAHASTPAVRYTPVGIFPAQAQADARVGAARPPAAQPTVASLVPREYGAHIRASGAGDAHDAGASADADLPVERLAMRRLLSAARAHAAALGGQDAARAALATGRSVAVSDVYVAAARAAESNLRGAVRMLNADVAYSGPKLHSLTAKEAELIMPMLAILLPTQVDLADLARASDSVALAASVGAMEVLAALSRLASGAPVPAAAFLSTAGAPARVTACLRAHSAGVAAEACRAIVALIDVGSEAQRAAGKNALLSKQAACADLAACIRRGGRGGGVAAAAAAPSRAAQPAHTPTGAQTSSNPAKTATETKPVSAPTGSVARSAGSASGEASALLTVAAACALEQCVCSPGRSTTSATITDQVLAEFATAGRALFALFKHPAVRASHVAASIMRTLAEEGNSERCAAARNAALCDGAVLVHLRAALFEERADRREESRLLVSLWCDAHSVAMSLLGRCLPEGLLSMLQEPRSALKHISSAAAMAALDDVGGVDPESVAGRGVGAIANVGKQVSAAGDGGSRLRCNWDALWATADQSWASPSLVWNDVTRAELRHALDREIATLELEQQREEYSARAAVEAAVDQTPVGGAGGTAFGGSVGHVSWNHREFYVRYPSLEEEVRICGTFVRHLIENAAPLKSPEDGGGAGLDGGGMTSQVRSPERSRLSSAVSFGLIRQPAEFFYAAYRELLELADVDVAPLGDSAPRRVDKRHLCVQAMSAAYSQQAGAIGPFKGVPHCGRLIDHTLDAGLRDKLLLLFRALVTSGPNASLVEANAGAMVDAGLVDVLACIVAGAHGAGERALMPMASNLLTATAHVEPLKVWYYIADDAGVDVSSYNPWEMGASCPAGVSCVGPLSRAELRQAFSHGKATGVTRVRARGDAVTALGWQRLRDVRELRWMAAAGRRTLSPQEAAAAALETLIAIVTAAPSVDADGDPVRPIPKAKRALCAPHCLAHVAQAMLCGDARVADLSARLLKAVVAYNPATMVRLYRTGVFYFALAYPGSNLAALSDLLCASHMRQDSTAAPGAGAHANTQGSLASRSALGDLLPESLLQIAETYGAAALAQALTADADTPELIWTRSMREERLVAQLTVHLGDFPRALAENHCAVYEYAPIAPITYPALEDEVWCHRYYLRSLADEERFPGWRIKDVVDVVRALLAAWRAELAKKPMSMSETDAAAELELKEDWHALPRDERESLLKRAYRRLAMRYHPDKNPGGLARFRAVRAAYDRLRAGAAGAQGAAPWRVVLLLRAQCACYRRQPTELAPFMYAGFPLLLAEVERAADAPPGALVPAPRDMSTAGDSGDRQHACVYERAAASSELILLTCMASVQNGDAVARAGGVVPLGALLARTAAAAPADVSDADHRCAIGADVLRTLAGLAALASARDAFDVEAHAVVRDVVRCTRLGDAPLCCDAALRTCGNLCAAPAMQGAIARAGLIFRCLVLMLRYDATLKEEGDTEKSRPDDTDAPDNPSKPVQRNSFDQGASNARVAPGAPAPGTAGQVIAVDAATGKPADAGSARMGPGVPTNVQRHRNELALRASEVLARLCGCLGAAANTPEAKVNASVVTALLTPGVARLLARGEHTEVMGILTSSIETCTILWNSRMRAELESHLDKAIAVEPGEEGYDLAEHASFKFDALKDELVVGGVYVRVYNEKPATLANPVAFAGTALEYASNCAVEADAGDARAHARASASLNAAQIAVASTSPGASMASLKLSMLQPWLLAGAEEATAAGADAVGTSEAALRVVAAACARPGAPQALAPIVRRIFQLTLLGTEAARELSAHALSLVADSATVAKESALGGGILYVLASILPLQASADRPKHSLLPDRLMQPYTVLLSKLLRERVHGERACAMVRAHLPQALVDALRDDETGVVSSLASRSETPALVWSRELACSASTRLLAACTAQVASQRERAEAYEAAVGTAYVIPGELYVGGIFVRLFVKDPAFALRDSKRTAEALLDYFEARGESLMSGASDVGGETESNAVLVSNAATLLIRSYPTVGEHLAMLGKVPRIVALLPTDTDTSARMSSVEGAALRLVHQLVASGDSARSALAGCAGVAARLKACIGKGTAAASLAIEALSRALPSANARRDALVQQCVAAGLLEVLLDLLSEGEGGEGGAGSDEAEADVLVVRALAVDVIRLLSAEGAFADVVREKLAASAVWAAHSGADHALFLPASAREQSGGAAALVGSTHTLALPAPEDVARSALQNVADATAARANVSARAVPVDRVGRAAEEAVENAAEVQPGSADLATTEAADAACEDMPGETPQTTATRADTPPPEEAAEGAATPASSAGGGADDGSAAQDPLQAPDDPLQAASAAANRTVDCGEGGHPLQ